MRNRTERARLGRESGKIHNSFFLARALPRDCDYDKKKSWFRPRKEKPMKNTMKKALALALAVLMMASLSVAAFADGEAELTGGEVGGFTSPDTPTAQNKTLILKKELTAYNLDETQIQAPTISYTYTIAPVEPSFNVTDEASDHATGIGALTVPTKAGITEGVAITGTIGWTNAETLNADTDGAANYKDLKIDFSNVVFTGPGIYRYVITETAPNYAASGVTATTGTHTRYLDVYVKAADTFNDGSTAEEWVIYGYVCMYDSEDVDPVADTTTTGAMKTNGFVAGTNDGTEIKADSYYTFNVTVSKTVVNDNYAKATHAFPFTVIFTNAAVTQSVDISSKTTVTNTPTGFVDPAPAALSAGNTKGVVFIKDGASVKYIGIPNGTSVEVYETNDMTGVIYQVTTTLTPTGTAPTTDNSVSWDDAPTVAVAQAAEKEAFQSTKATITTTPDVDDDNAYAVAVTNRLLTISPTGVSLRVAPYALMLCAGLLLVFFSRRRKANAESED